MRHEILSLEVKTSVAAGTEQIVDRFREKTVHIHGTWAATLRIEGTIGSADWSPVSGDIAANGLFTIPQAITKIRINTLAYTSGTPVAHFGGLDSRVGE